MSGTIKALKLENRAVIALKGSEAGPLLQGLITNDINRLKKDRPLFAALLTPQGKYLFDFLIFEAGDGLLLDCEAARKDELIKRLTFYKLRADVDILDASGRYAVWAFAPGVSGKEVSKKWIDRSIYPDPRHPALGARAVMQRPPENIEPWAYKAYEELRLSLGVPDSSRDIEVDKRFILEANLDHLNGVDFKKGCYVGQEMTARMHYRGTLKKRLLPATIEGPLPAPMTAFRANGKAAGHVLSGQDSRAMTLTRLEFLDKAPFKTEAGVKIAPFVPDWLKTGKD